MSTPASLLPPNENKRLETLRAYDILHSLKEPLFTSVVEVIATLFNVPISLIALVDADEVVYKATHGLPDLRRQPRAEAICSMAVGRQEAVVFSDLRHTRSLTPEAKAAAQAKGLLFYAGVPLCMPSRHCIGTLCIIDHAPRAFSAPEQEVLEQFAHVVERLIAVRQYCGAGQARSSDHWSVVCAELVQQVQAVMKLVQQRDSTGVSSQVPADLLEIVDQHLTALRWMLADYCSGPL
ncbi:MAG TPA: GAF domain-containing protein [Hymenobacter sp.]|uniref:GAF domain-containing protein n=1 Tax=Hymenobacter sp. TaxID=1898978 RepID=UPI002D7EA65E|nr:GAF domain-containing protein [Hymenobacter sp.]HET9506065.1 GAF domain-containing protein [Hymenobacter sp.]